jgi:hypothetical protein
MRPNDLGADDADTRIRVEPAKRGRHSIGGQFHIIVERHYGGRIDHTECRIAATDEPYAVSNLRIGAPRTYREMKRLSLSSSDPESTKISWMSPR